MNTLLTRVQDRTQTFLYGRSHVCCVTCGATVRPNRAVWRGSRAYCSASHEHADLDALAFSSSATAVRTLQNEYRPAVARLVYS